MNPNWLPIYELSFFWIRCLWVLSFYSCLGKWYVLFYDFSFPWKQSTSRRKHSSKQPETRLILALYCSLTYIYFLIVSQLKSRKKRNADHLNGLRQQAKSSIHLIFQWAVYISAYHRCFEKDTSKNKSELQVLLVKSLIQCKY